MKAILTLPTSPAKHLAFLRKLKKLNTINDKPIIIRKSDDVKETTFSLIKYNVPIANKL
ncbi:hypothetical protein GCM10022246_38520 [Pedobacter ginsengiterrae]|uniref:Uncharacterized protein n=1 Tax=Pedobacter ginsengiterrae TaxID=871696 RepID=A0ABP7QIV9_9SPHI